MTVTKGEFLQEKMQNMRVWLLEEFKRENRACAQLPLVTEMEACYLADSLLPHERAIGNRNFVSLSQDKQLDASFREVLAQIQATPAMHDKFWRYVDLFLCVAKQ